MECDNLDKVYYDGTIEDWCKIILSNEDSNPMTYANHFYIKNSNNEYRKVTELEIPYTVDWILSYQFCGFSYVTNIKIPDSVQIIDEGAFMGCSSLTIINVDSNNKYYTSIEGNLYSYDKKL